MFADELCMYLKELFYDKQTKMFSDMCHFNFAIKL